MPEPLQCIYCEIEILAKRFAVFCRVNAVLTWLYESDIGNTVVNMY